MDNIAVLVVDVRPPGAVERSEPASTEVEVMSSSEPDGVSVGHLVSSEGAPNRPGDFLTRTTQREIDRLTEMGVQELLRACILLETRCMPKAVLVCPELVRNYLSVIYENVNKATTLLETTLEKKDFFSISGCNSKKA